MPFSDGFRHDLFVGYARHDERASKWVTKRLGPQLQSGLNANLGQAPEIFLEAPPSPPSRMVREIEAAAAFLVVLTTSLIEADSIARFELDEIAARAGERPVFLSAIEPIEMQALPLALRGIHIMRFAPDGSNFEQATQDIVPVIADALRSKI